jgi:hypothetical protein
MVGVVATGMLASVGVNAGVAAAALPVFPENIVTFPNRDMITLEGFDVNHAGEAVVVRVHSPAGVLMGATKGSINAAGAFEVNHPGGSCWGNDPSYPKVTPNIVAGDKVSVEFVENGTTVLAGDSVVQEGFVEEGGVHYVEGATTFTVTGRVDPTIPAENIEQRIVNPDLVDTAVARRDIRALAGPLTPAAKGGYSSSLTVNGDGSFTATYDFGDSGAEAAANARTAATGGGERLMTWQETDGAGNRQGLTIAELGEPGGAGMGGCPAGPGDVAPTSGSYGVVWGTSTAAGTAQVTWTPAAAQPGAAAVTGYSVVAIAKNAATSGDKAVIGARSGATATRSTLTGLTGGAQNWDIEVRAQSGGAISSAFPAAAAGGTSPGTGTGNGDGTAPTVTSAQNATSGAVTLTASETNADIYFTTDGTEPLGAGGMLNEGANVTLYTAPIAITGPVTVNWVVFDLAGNTATGTGNFDKPAAPAATAPGIPAGVTARAGATSGTVNLSWTAPTNTGGAAISGYTVAVTAPAITGTGAAPAFATSVQSTTTTATVPELTNGREYTFTVTATNSAGTSAASTGVRARPGEAVTITLSRNKANDVRIVGSGSATGGTYTVYRGGTVGIVQGATRIGTGTVTARVAPATGADWDLRLRTAALPRGTVVWVLSTAGGVASVTTP